MVHGQLLNFLPENHAGDTNYSALSK
jgi:hypothetical protein